jgi:hypothetical protein
MVNYECNTLIMSKSQFKQVQFNKSIFLSYPNKIKLTKTFLKKAK